MRKIHASQLSDGLGTIVKDRVVVVNDDAIVEGIYRSEEYSFEDAEHYDGLLCPGFINAHCHLELSYLQNKIPEHTGLVNFIQQILTIRNDSDSGITDAMIDAEQEMRKEGIVAVGDISNGAVSFDLKSKRKLRYHTFVESFGLDASQAESHFQDARKILNEARMKNLPGSITPHAPYSMSDELLERILSPLKNEAEIFSYHNQESDEENKFFRGEKSDFDSFYKSFNFRPPNRKGTSSIRVHLPLFPKDSNVLFVHNTFTSKEEVDWAMNEHPHLYFCFCPSANLYIENTLPAFQNFLAYNDRLCIATDSLASNHSLSMLREMKLIQQKDPSVATAQLIRWATKNAATFFGWNDLGSIETGMKPGLNLITGLDPDLKFSKESKVTKLL